MFPLSSTYPAAVVITLYIDLFHFFGKKSIGIYNIGLDWFHPPHDRFSCDLFELVTCIREVR